MNGEKAMERRTFTSRHDGTIQEHLLQLPETFPVRGGVIYLHGATNHLDQGMNEEIFEGTFKYLKLWARNRGFAYACPEYRGDSWMNEAAESDVAQLVSVLREEFRVRRPVMVGGSMGATAALIFAARRPGTLEGVIAFCPATDMVLLYRSWEEGPLGAGIRAAYGGTPEDVPETYRERSSVHFPAELGAQPVYCLHGEADTLISVEHSRLLAKLLAGCVDFHFEEIPGGTHNSLIAPVYLERALTWIESRVKSCSDPGSL